MRSLSPNAFRQLFAQESDDPFLICLTLEHSSFTQPIRVVHNNEPIQRQVGEYLACFFDITLPEETSERTPQVTLTIDNVDRSITDAIRTVSGRVKVTMEVILASTPDTVEAGPFIFYILGVSYNAMKVAGTLGFEDDVLNMAFPADSYTPTNSGGLFS